MSKIVACLFILISFLSFPTPVFAVTVAITDHPSEISDEPFSITVQISSAQADTTNYLRIDLYENGSISYFGYTYNGTDFYNGSDYKQYPTVSIGADGSASKIIEGRVDTTSGNYKGSGDYMLRVRRYTGSGGYSAQEANAGAVSLKINITEPTPTPTPTPTPQSSTSQSTSNTKSPTPTPKATSTTTIKSPSPTSTKQSPQVLSASDQDSLLLASLSAENTSPSPTPEATPSALSKTKVAGILAGSGIVLIGLSISFYFWYHRILGSPKKEQSEDQT